MARQLLLVLLTLLATAATPSLHAASPVGAVSSTPPAGDGVVPVSRRRLGPAHDLQRPVAPDDDDAVSASSLPVAPPAAQAARPPRDRDSSPATDTTPAAADASHPNPAAAPRAVHDVTEVFRATRRLGPPRLRYSVVPAGADDDTTNNNKAAPNDASGGVMYYLSLLDLGADLLALAAVVGCWLWLAPRPLRKSQRVRVRVTRLRLRRRFVCPAP